MTTAGTINRRKFLKGSAGAAALLGLAPTIIPAHVLGADAPNNKITVGFIGTGDHGTNWNLSYSLKNPAAKVIAVCDVDETRLYRAKETVNDRNGNEDCWATKDFRE